MKFLSIFYIILVLFFTGCSVYHVEVEEQYHPNQKYTVDDDFDSLNLSEINKKIFMQDVERCRLKNKKIGKKYIFSVIKNKYDNLAKCLINSNDDLINTKIDKSTPLLIALKYDNKEMIRFIIAKDLNLSLEDYTYAALKNGYVDLSYKFFKKTYVLKYNDYALGLKEFSANNDLNLNICNLESNNKALNKFLSDIQSNGKLDISHYCKQNNYFTLLAFSKENPTYKSQQVKKELDTLLTNNALKSYKIALVYLNKHPNTTLALKVKKQLKFLMYKEIMKNNSLELAEVFLIKYPKSKSKNRILRKIYNLSSDSILLLEHYIKKYPNNKLLISRAKKRLEYLTYKSIMKNNSYELAKDFLIKYQNSQYKDQVFSKIKKIAIVKIKNQYFNKYDDLKWKGKINNYGWPVGKGDLHIERYIRGIDCTRGLFGTSCSAKLRLILDIHTTFLNGKFHKGIVSGYYTKYGWFQRTVSFDAYKYSFASINGLFDRIKQIIKDSESEFYKYGETQRQNSSSGSISIKHCHMERKADGSGNYKSCEVFVNGSFKTTVSAMPDNDDYQIDVYRHDSGVYFPNIHQLSYGNCGNKSNVDLNEAIYYSAECAINGHY